MNDDDELERITDCEIEWDLDDEVDYETMEDGLERNTDHETAQDLVDGEESLTREGEEREMESK